MTTTGDNGLTPLEVEVRDLLPTPPAPWRWRENRNPSVRHDQVDAGRELVNLTLEGPRGLAFNISVMPIAGKDADREHVRRVSAQSTLLYLRRMVIASDRLSSEQKANLVTNIDRWLERNVREKTVDLGIGWPPA